jgi:2-oxoglutarate ferredoxin oxidoreductase subunit alpha
VIARMKMKRRTKQESLIRYLQEKIQTVNEFGTGDPCVFTFGSTTMSVREAVIYADLSCTVVQPIYLQPFPSWNLRKYVGRKVVVVEQNSTGQLEQLLREKIGITPVSSIRQFDGRPFNPVDLAEQLRTVIE